MSDLLHILFKPGWEQLPGSLALWLGLAVVGILIAIAGWRVSRVRPLPPQRRRAVPWNGLAILVIWAVSLLAVGMVAGFLLQIGFYRWLYGPGFSEPLARRSEMDSIRLSLWATVIAFPFQVAVVLAFLRSASEAMPYQLGLTTRRAGQNLLLGLLACASVLPVVYLFHTLAVGLYQHWMPSPPEHHPLERLVEAGPTTAEWGLVVFSAVFVAPIWEELLFRGILQPWLTLRPENSDWAYAAILAVVVFRAATSLVDRGWSEAVELLQPVAFVFVMGLIYLAVRIRQHSPVPGAIITSALFFAAFHQNWPTPIPLFVLALALGFLAYRTQSLVAPIVLHALFNGFACALLMT